MNKKMKGKHKKVLNQNLILLCFIEINTTLVIYYMEINNLRYASLLITIYVLNYLFTLLE
jgi:hypothetical protein